MLLLFSSSHVKHMHHSWHTGCVRDHAQHLCCVECSHHVVPQYVVAVLGEAHTAVHSVGPDASSMQLRT